MILTPGVLKDVKTALSITSKQELSSRVGDKMKSPAFYEPVGCDLCENTWYKGRVGIYEVLEITPWVKEMILQWNSAYII